ncbi:hypothetical protein QTJ16_004489 [Diplocarpon rosae]|uniref:DUF7371 domain-containing protein n=1 Tax=Diplocarpon rosae TaxID=946125 RepID=A0AAD9T060_9HELO|nr:hypothetical protein QTJ16_004489 [Diplocarpon rosae]PBP24618.1 hypothetical protein BUE80_DR004365 [Diplocarpon rosae]
MRFRLPNVVAGTIGLAAILAAALDHPFSNVCGTGVATIYITAPQLSTITVTAGQTKTATVYLSAATSVLPTTTVTRVYTISSTTTSYIDLSSISIAAVVSSPVSYKATITSTSFATITVHKPEKETPSSSSLLAFIVNDGSTFWFGGRTPSSPYVVKTSVVTIIPVSQADTSTTTLESTVHITRPHTITQTVSTSNSSSKVHVPSHISIGNSSWNGWNATSIADGVGFPSATDLAKPSKASISFIAEETVDIYKTSTLSYLVSTYTAQGGFNPSSTTPSLRFSAIPTTSALSIARSAWATALINGETASWNTNGATLTCTGESTSVSISAPFSNTTAGYQSTSAADGTLKFLSKSSDASSSSYPANSTSAALGVVTSTSSISGLSATLSQWYSYPLASTGVGHPSSTSAALSSLTSDLSSSGLTSKNGSASVTPRSHMGVFPWGTLSSTLTSTSRSSVIPSSHMGVFPWETSSSVKDFFNSSSTATANSYMGVFPTEIASSFFTSYTSPSSVVDPSATAKSSSSFVSSASPASSTCGQIGDFLLNFDDIPPLSISNGSTNFQPAPLFNPYHKFDFSNGFTVVPPPVDPYLPESKPLLLEFIPNFTVNNTTPASGPNSRQGGFSGEIGDADHGASGCFSFNFYGASFGCDSSGPDCDFTFTGFKYDRSSGETNPVTTQELSVAACPDLKSLACILTSVSLDATFEDLDSVRVNVTVQGEPKIWWVDDIRLGWFDNTCEQGLCRDIAHIH